MNARQRRKARRYATRTLEAHGRAESSRLGLNPDNWRSYTIPVDATVQFCHRILRAARRRTYCLRDVAMEGPPILTWQAKVLRECGGPGWSQGQAVSP